MYFIKTDDEKWCEDYRFTVNVLVPVILDVRWAVTIRNTGETFTIPTDVGVNSMYVWEIKRYNYGENIK